VIGSSAELRRAAAKARVVDHRRGVLPELFDQDWALYAKAGLLEIEPGHHFEWVWLLGELAARGGRVHLPLARRLWDFAQRHGIDQRRNVAIDKVDSAGGVGAARARLWPQTEWLKAACTLTNRRVAALSCDGGAGRLLRPDGARRPLRGRTGTREFALSIVCAYWELIRAAEHAG
jgi:mannose/cellobiose epimerase-like protein (N-acyl-D-glucosamine 2-epimerase family)